jgi:hypothetical protein
VRADYAPLAAAPLYWPRAHSGSPAKPALMAQGSAAPLPGHPRRKCSALWQTQETLCHLRRGSARKSEWPREVAPIGDVLFRACVESSVPLTIVFTTALWASHGPNAPCHPCKPQFLAAVPATLPGNAATHMESHAVSGARTGFCRYYDPRLEIDLKVQGFSLEWQFWCLFD